MLNAIGSVLGSTSYDLPHIQTLTFGETEEYEELRGDDKLWLLTVRVPRLSGI